MRQVRRVATVTVACQRSGRRGRWGALTRQAITWIAALLVGGMLQPAAQAQAPLALPLVLRGGSSGCPTISDRVYASGTAYRYDRDNPVRQAEAHADKNLALRGYGLAPNQNLPALVDYGWGGGAAPPQFATLFEPPRVPAVVAFYCVHDWLWAPSPQPGTRGAPLTIYPVTALGLATHPGEALHVPTSGYDLGQGVEALVLYADEDAIALRYTREDSSASAGYTVHLDGLCVDPNLLALYRSLDAPGGPRYDMGQSAYPLPALRAGQVLGTARGTGLAMAIADTGAFLDPRSQHEWWRER